MATHSSTLAWRIPQTEEPGGLWSTVSQSWTWLKDYTQHEKEEVSPFAEPPPSLSTTVWKWAVLWSFSSWYIRKNPKPHSDNKFSSWFLCQMWSGFRPSYSATLEQAATDQPQLLEPLPWTLFIPSSISTSFIFHVYLSFCLLGVNDLQGSVSWTFRFFHSTYSPDPTFFANDSQICIFSQSCLLSPTDTANHLLDFFRLFHTQSNALSLSSVLPFHICAPC